MRSGTHKVVCPYCRRILTYISMRAHVATKHPGGYDAVFGTPMPKNVCPECGKELYTKHMAAHRLTAHDVVNAKDRKSVRTLKRMRERPLAALLAAESAAQNSRKARIRSALDRCGGLRSSSSSSSAGARGLDVTTVWPVDTSGVEAAVMATIGPHQGQPKNRSEAIRLWCAQQLALVREEADKEVTLASGATGGYEEVAKELEEMLSRGLACDERR